MTEQLGWIFAIIFFIICMLWNFVPGMVHGSKQITPDAIMDGQNGIQYVGHGTVFLQMDGKRILTDPVLDNRLALVLRRYINAGIDQAVLKTIDIVVISHTHTDHFHIASLKKINPNVQIIVPVGVKNRLTRNGFHNVIELKIGEKIDWKGIQIYGVPTQHSTVRNAMGFVFQGSWSVYFPGDTALSEPIMRGIARKFSIDLALLPIGCFRGSIFGIIPIFFSRIHMAPEQLIEANDYLHPKAIVPIHWGTFRIGSEPITEAYERVQIVKQNNQVPLLILSHGKWKIWEEIVHDLQN